MENEIMNYEEMEVIEVEPGLEEKSGMSTGTAMLIGAGLTLAVTAGVKLVKKGIAWAKAKLAEKKADEAEDEDQSADDVTTK